MKRIFKMAILITGLVAAWWVLSSLPLEDSNTIHAQSAYPFPNSSILSGPYPAPLIASPSPDPYPGPSMVTKTPKMAATQIPTVTSFSIDVEIDGLNLGETANLKILPGKELTTESINLQKLALPEISATNGGYTMTITSVPVGVYKVVVDAPPIYIRKPMGYLFGISEKGELLSNSKDILRFSLIPPLDQWLPSCRYLDLLPEKMVVVGEPACVAEGIHDLLSPPRNPTSGQRVLTGTYHYAGPKTTQDNYGVWGRNYVVDPSVIHDGSYNQFVAERVYADFGSSWIEAGWIEDSWKDERQYIYVSGAFAGGLIFYPQYNLMAGSAVETRVRYLAPLDKWIAEYFNTGSNQWVVLEEANTGFTTADNGYNRGEVYTTIPEKPLLPPSTFVLGKLFVEGSWRVWDYQYEASTSVRMDPPYTCDMHDEYYHFTIHSPIIYLPLVMK